MGNRFNASRRSQAEDLKKASANHENILIVGPGNGVDLKFYSNIDANLVLVEPSLNMAKILTKKVEGLQNVQIINKDFLNVHLQRQMFDKVLLHFVLSATPKPNEMLSKASSLLKADGVISVLDVAQPIPKWSKLAFNWFTKRTMFDLKLDLEKLFKELEFNLYLTENLIEFKIFKRWILKK